MNLKNHFKLRKGLHLHLITNLHLEEAEKTYTVEEEVLAIIQDKPSSSIGTPDTNGSENRQWIEKLMRKGMILRLT